MNPQSKKLSESEVIKNIRWDEFIIPNSDPKPCKHYFEFVSGGECKCKMCGFGLIGVFDIIDGKPI